MSLQVYLGDSFFFHCKWWSLQNSSTYHPVTLSTSCFMWNVYQIVFQTRAADSSKGTEKAVVLVYYLLAHPSETGGNNTIQKELEMHV